MQNSLNTYVIERTLAGAGKLSDQDLQGISTRSNTVLRDLGPDVQWVHSYVTADKIYCVYRAKNPDIIREHARRGEFPIDSVNLVSRVIDPTSGATS